MERNHVCLETAQKLKAAGFPQKTAIRWVDYSPGSLGWSLQISYGSPFKKPQCAAPTGEEIAAQIDGDIKLIREGKTWYACHPKDGGLGVGSGNSIVESLAQHWLRRQEVKQLRQSNGEPTK